MLDAHSAVTVHVTHAVNTHWMVADPVVKAMLLKSMMLCPASVGDWAELQGWDKGAEPPCVTLRLLFGTVPPCRDHQLIIHSACLIVLWLLQTALTPPSM